MLKFILQASRLLLLYYSSTKRTILIFIRCLGPENIFFEPSNNSEKFCEESVVFHKHPELQARASACCNNEDFCNEQLVHNLTLPSPG